MEKKLIDILKKQNGIIFANLTIVYRNTYTGRNIIAQNSQNSGLRDSRGYLPVERWIMSLTEAQNDLKKPNEGLTEILIGDSLVLLSELAKKYEEELFGKYKKNWPLTKILDIGGEKVHTSFSTEAEVPPIPVHVHSGSVIDDKLISPGKLEAYFFPPVNISPYNQDLGKVITRLGLRPDVKKEEFLKAIKAFGKEDNTYTFCNIFKINPYDCWTINPKIVHAPGPWTTLEIQTPQDDFNLLSWKMGQRIKESELQQIKKKMLFRGLKSEEEVLEQAIDWNLSADPDFKKNNYRSSKLIYENEKTKVLQIFFNEFYGEALEIAPYKSLLKKADERPYAGIVWSGKGTINKNQINVDEKKAKEFLVTPFTNIEIENTGDSSLLIYTVYPIKMRYNE